MGLLASSRGRCAAEVTCNNMKQTRKVHILILVVVAVAMAVMLVSATFEDFETDWKLTVDDDDNFPDAGISKYMVFISRQPRAFFVLDRCSTVTVIVVDALVVFVQVFLVVVGCLDGLSLNNPNARHQEGCNRLGRNAHLRNPH